MTQKKEEITTEFFGNAAKYFAGEMNESEAKKFEEICGSDNLLKEEIRHLEQLWNDAEKITKFDVIDTEKALQRINKRVHSLKRRKGFLFYLERIAAILFIPLLFASVLYYYANKPVRQQKSAYNELDNAYGTVSKLTLPDGTKVWLNSGSHFKYPLFFTRGLRKVFLSGEAYFEVAKDKKRPFVVKTCGIDVVATGTIFDVMAYDDDNDISSTLLRGKIYLAKKTGDLHKLRPIVFIKPGQKAVLDKEQKKISVLKTDVDEVIAWKDGKLIFRNDPMDVVVKKLDRWYNTKIILVDKELKSYRYTATFTGETLPQILELLKHSAPIEYNIYPRKKRSDHTFTKEMVEIRIRKDHQKIHKPAK